MTINVLRYQTCQICHTRKSRIWFPCLPNPQSFHVFRIGSFFLDLDVGGCHSHLLELVKIYSLVVWYDVWSCSLLILVFPLAYLMSKSQKITWYFNRIHNSMKLITETLRLLLTFTTAFLFAALFSVLPRYIIIKESKECGCHSHLLELVKIYSLVVWYDVWSCSLLILVFPLAYLG
jgi:hypothetical protein